MSDLKELSQSQIPLERVAPLQSNRLVTFVNHFIVSIVQQLNELSSVVDSRLFDINNQIIRCNTNLVILEMKLNSISGLSSASEVVNGEATQPIPKPMDSPLPQNETIIDTINDVIDARINIDTDSTPIEHIDDSEVKEESEEKDSEPEDPRLAKYKKMVHMGIPLAAVQQKMTLEGVDPQLLS